MKDSQVHLTFGNGMKNRHRPPNPISTQCVRERRKARQIRRVTMERGYWPCYIYIGHNQLGVDGIKLYVWGIEISSSMVYTHKSDMPHFYNMYHLALQPRRVGRSRSTNYIMSCAKRSLLLKS